MKPEQRQSLRAILALAAGYLGKHGQEHVVPGDDNGRNQTREECAVKRAEIFRRLHHAPPILVLPNCWDPATARIIEIAGFPAVATSSAAVANAHGVQDGDCLDVSVHLAAVARIVEVVNVPVSVDFESGYAEDTAKLGRNIVRLAATGAAGYNLEDSRAKGELYSLAEQCERIAAAKTAAPQLFHNARCDIFLYDIGAADSQLERTKERLAAYLEAGADGIFVPGLADPVTITDIARTFRKKPLNVLAGANMPAVTELEACGVSRVSLGSWPMRRAMTVLRDIARELHREGTFGFMGDPAIGYDEMNALFTR
jgi:2-methylisocitrate lyase-like PEP mutase family enzyme